MTATVDGRTWPTSVWHDRKEGPLLAVPKRFLGAKRSGDRVRVTLVRR